MFLPYEPWKTYLILLHCLFANLFLKLEGYLKILFFRSKHKAVLYHLSDGSLFCQNMWFLLILLAFTYNFYFNIFASLFSSVHDISYISYMMY